MKLDNRETEKGLWALAFIIVTATLAGLAYARRTLCQRTHPMAAVKLLVRIFSGALIVLLGYGIINLLLWGAELAARVQYH